jgi:hypothetical protein
VLIESKVRAEFDTIMNLGASPLRKARKFLALEKRLSLLARHLANLGFASSEKENPTARKLLWASSAKILHFAQQAREFARQSLYNRPPKIGFDYGPQAYATPNWAPVDEHVQESTEVAR